MFKQRRGFNVEIKSVVQRCRNVGTSTSNQISNPTKIQRHFIAEMPAGILSFKLVILLLHAVICHNYILITLDSMCCWCQKGHGKFTVPDEI